MIALRLSAARPSHVLGALALVLAAVAIWPWLVPPVPGAKPLAAVQANAPAPALAPLPPLASYAAVVERPLFSPSRRPAPGTSAAAGPSVESRYRLLGVVATGPRKKAFIADGSRRLDITEGDALEGWTVKTIRPDSVILTSPAGEAALKMKPAAAEPPQKPQ